MYNLSTYILEKLRINKNLSIDNDELSMEAFQKYLIDNNCNIFEISDTKWDISIDLKKLGNRKSHEKSPNIVIVIKYDDVLKISYWNGFFQTKDGPEVHWCAHYNGFIDDKELYKNDLGYSLTKHNADLIVNYLVKRIR